MSVLNQNFGQLVGGAGVRHLHTVKTLIGIMIVNKQRRNVPLPDLLVETDIRIREKGACSFNNKSCHIAVEQTFQINRLIVQPVLCDGYIDVISGFLHNRIDSIINAGEQIVRKIA